ncbi:MAG: polyprenyl synthetase family protein, partial [Chloroflexota bacterium]
YALSHLAMSRLADSRGEATGQDLRILSEHTLPVASPVPAPIVVQALRRFDETCVHLTQGQYADMEFETRLDVGVEEYLTMIEGKTAALVGLAAELGALVAGQPPAVVSHYAAFGRDLGLAFQVKDDILGIWGEEELIGKSAATDIATGKKTLPVLYGLAHSERLRALYDRSESDEQFVGAAVALLDAVGARAFADGHASAYSESALDHLAAAKAQGPAHAALHELAHQLLYRKS